MRARLALASAALSVLAVARCSAVLDFGLEGLPCGDGGACLDGYACVSSVCQATPPDAGPPPTPCQGACLAGQTCRDEQCVYDCPAGKCPPGMRCNTESHCEAVPTGEVGASCTSSGECTTSGTSCLRAMTGTGICAAESVVLDGGANNCPSLGGVAKTFQPGPGDPVRLCVPSSFAQCARQADCDPMGLQCAFWNLPSSPLVAACAWAVDGGATIDQACDSASCKNGLCIDGPAGGRYCSEPCRLGIEADCQLPEHQCRVGSLGGAPPAVTFCMRPQTTLMCSCTMQGSAADPVCASDAPLCADTEGTLRCRAPCLAPTDCPTGDACSDGLCVNADSSLPPVPDGGC